MTTPRLPTRPARAPLALLSALVVSLVGIHSAAAGVGVGDRAAEFRNVKTADGERVALRALRGKVVVVTFGASWCDPCKRELPALEQLASRFAARDADVAVIAVNVDEDRGDGRRFMSRFDFEHVRPAFDPNRATAGRYGPPTMPSTYVIDQNGLVRAVHRGYRPGDEAKVRRAVQELL